MALHVDSGGECAVAHWDDGKLLDACRRCAVCHEWIRPENMQDDCPSSTDVAGAATETPAKRQ